MPRTIRTLALDEVETLVDWAAAEGWNPGLGDAAAFQAADPEGFIGAFVGGEMVGGISAVAYGDDFGFIGLYICRPDRRGEGHGKAVWDAGMPAWRGSATARSVSMALSNSRPTTAAWVLRRPIGRSGSSDRRMFRQKPTVAFAP